MISTRGRYAIRFLLDLAENVGDGFIPMKVVAKRQEISEKYLEQILPVLVKSGLVVTSHGKGGGYMLNRSPKDIKVSEILFLTEGELVPVACLSCNAKECARKDNCKTLPMWEKYNNMINNFFSGISIEDLQKGKIKDMGL